MRRLLKLLVHAVVVGLVVSTALLWSGPATARTVPETLADPRPVRAGTVQVNFEIVYLGVLWKTPAGQEHVPEGAGPEPNGAVRFLTDDQWGPWIPLIEDGAEAEGQWASGLVAGGDAEAYQVRGLPAGAVDATAVAINTTDGDPVAVAQSPGGTAQALSGRCRSRADWGADETLRHDAAGKEVWPPEYHDVQATTVHHTATTNDDPDPAATVRAIYRYHAVDNGWGDIGYQYLIDEAGVVYEGRWSGATSPSCGAGGTGDEFAHDEVTGKLVTAAHTGGWNSGNAGVALLGEFTTNRRFGAEPKAAAVSALEGVLADLAERHGLNPQVPTTYVNPVSGEIKEVQTIAGHRDYLSTECPGQRLYERLPEIRSNVAALLEGSSGGGDTGGDTGSGGSGGTAHVGDLDGVAAAASRNQWTTTVTTTVVDAAEPPAAVAGAVVEGTWTTTGTKATCTTGTDGTCAVESPRLSKGTASATFQVDAVNKEAWTYDPGTNTDPDGDSDGTTITVVRPG